MKTFTLIISTWLFALTAFAASPLIPPKARFLDANGNPLAGGLVYTYAAGTTTPLATYTDAAEGTPNANPVVLDANGEANIWIDDAAYKIVLKNSADVTQWTVDNVNQTIPTSQLRDLSVTTAKIAADAVTTAKIADANVTTAKIADLNITTAKIAAGAVTSAKLATSNYVMSAAIGGGGSTSTSSGTYADITNMTLSITTTGRPVLILATGDNSSTSTSYIRPTISGTSADCQIKLVRGATDLAIYQYVIAATGATGVDSYGPAPMWFDTPSAATYTYKLQWKAGAGTCTFARVRLVAIEL